MKDFILTRILKLIGDKMDGYKTYVGAMIKILLGFSSIISGIIGFIGIALPDQGLPKMDVNTAWGLIGAGGYGIGSGLTSFGIGHKLEKASDQRIAIAQATQAAQVPADTPRAGGLPPIK